MELLSGADFKHFSNPGVTSIQFVSPHNSQSMRVTITHVTVEPGARQPRHSHRNSEQIWIAVKGEGTLLLGGDTTQSLKAGAVARFADGDVHGVENTGNEPFIYVSVTSPPIDFAYAYARHA